MKLGPLVTLALMTAALACSRLDRPRDEPPIPLDTLPGILSDVLLVESGVKEFPYTTRDSLALLHYGRVMALHGYTYEDLAVTMRWLQDDPQRVQAVYDEVMEILSTRESQAN